MASSKAKTVSAYLAELPADRRKDIAAVRSVVKKNLPAGYAETMRGMICYEIPLSTYPVTYNKQPLWYVGLAAQKNYNALYMMVAWDKKLHKKLKDGFKRAGKKLDMGVCCIRFKSAEHLPLDTIGEIVASTTPAEWIAIFETSRKK